MTTISVALYTDVLCVWAYVAELRVAAIERSFGDQVRFDYRCCSVFGATARKIETTWATKGGYAGFHDHLMEVGKTFPEVALNAELWRTVRPASSTGPHLFFKAIQDDEAAGGCAAGTAVLTLRNLRRAFFEDGRDIADWAVQCDVGRASGADPARIEARIHDGYAFAALALDQQDADAMGLRGSPTFVLNEGRQNLYGNVGYRILEANIQELLQTPRADQASWC